MKNSCYPIFLLFLLLISCEKEEITPISQFAFHNSRSNILKVGTNDKTLLINNSKDGVAYYWEFGDGSTSTEKDPVISYSKSGIYDIKLTVTSADGVKSESIKQIKVLDRILKKIVIDYIQWIPGNTLQNGISSRWPQSETADVYFQIQKYTDTLIQPLGIYPNCPVIYSSSIFKDVYHKTYDPIDILVEEKIVIEKGEGTFYFAFPENLNKGYVFSIMAKDDNGEIFNLQSNNGGGVGIGIDKENINDNIFIISCSLFSRFTLICTFE